MRSAWLKDVLREIWHTKSRFLSIFAIIALGAGFFSGLKATCPDMIETQRRYYEQQDLMDIRLLSTYGFDERDMDAIRSVPGVRAVEGNYFKDAFVESKDEKNTIARVASVSEEIDRANLVEGRFPEAPDECVIGSNPFSSVGFGIGDTVSVYTTDDENPLSDSLKRDSWKVVGIVQHPRYVIFDYGATDIGDGDIDLLMLVPKENFAYEVYTEVSMTFENTVGLRAYSDAYDAAAETDRELLETLAEKREKERLSEIKEDAEEELEKARKEFLDGKAEAEEEFGNAWDELQKAYDKLTKAEKEVKKGWKEYYDGYEEYLDGKEAFETGIAEAEELIAKGNKQYGRGVKKYKEGVRQFVEGIGDAVEKSGEEGRELLEEAGDAVKKGLDSEEFREVTEKAREIVETQMPEKVGELIDGVQQLADARRRLKSANLELESAEYSLRVNKEKGLSELADAEKELSDAKEELEKAEKKVRDGWEEYNDGLAEYQEEKGKVDKELADAGKEIADAEKELAELKEPVWYVFTRSDNIGYDSYTEDAERIERVAKVFPVFFLMVALLVCLTTMTRMIEEERTQIGTMKALGYRPGKILAKYLIYSSLASISGSVFGIALGSVVFPTTIYGAYRLVYFHHPIILVPNPVMWGLVTVACLGCTTAAVLMAGLSELRSVPASLMRPKAPKEGKRVFVERIPFLWNRLSFIRKVAVRNLFRYKKRIFMTVLGIAGCTALTLTGFGLHSSISNILDRQYGDIFHYDLVVALDTDAEEEERTAVYEELENDERTETVLPVYMQAVEYGSTNSTSLIATDDEENLAKMVSIKDYKTKEILSLPEDGVIITQRFSEVNDLSVGDPLKFRCAGVEVSTKVSGIAENYAVHYFYMKESLFREFTGEETTHNAILTVMTDPSAEAQEKISEKLVGRDGVLAVSFVRSVKETFGDMIANLDYIVVLVICSAALLAFVVLYNLTNINITERIREIATIKVLGFHDIEVSAYVFRENMLLTLMGAAVGLVLGIGLHRFVVSVAEVNTVMFDRTLPAWCFAMAFAMTLLFSLAVNGIMHFRLKKVSMVESLKSVE